MAATHESLAMLAAVRALDLDGVVSDVEIEETRAALRDAREMLANPLAYPPREEKDRAVVRQGAVEVRGREVRLGALDIENALILSDAFDLNELVCVELLVAAVERGAPPEQCLKPAAGMFLRERQNRVESLERLLRETLRNTGLSSQNQTRDFRDDRASLARVVDSFVADILTGVGGRTLIGRLCELLASPFPGDLAAAEAKASGAYVVQTPGGTAATPGGGVVPYGGNDVAGSGGSGVTGLLSDAAIAAAAADMTHVVDERGRLCRKKDWLAHERKLLAECLHRAVALAKRIHPSGSNTEANQKCLAARDDFESLARLFAETASPVLATAAADVRARAAATESAAAVGGGPTGPGANERGGSQRSFGPSAAGGGRFSNSAFGSNGAGGRSGSLEEPPSLSAAEARVGCIDELGDLAAGVADELPAALAILFATLEAVTTETGVAASGASSFSEAAAVAAAAAAFGPVLASASAAAAAQFRRARDGDDADAAAEMAAANPLRSAALGGGFGGLMFGRSQDRSAADDAAAEVSCARAEILELSRFTRGLAVLFATSSGTSGTSTNDASGRETTVEAAKKEIVAASDEGALVSLRCVLATGAFRDENEFSRRAYLDLSLKILRSAMRAALHDADLGDALAAVTPAMTAEQIAREERHAASADDFANRANRAQDNAFDAYGVPAYGHDGPVGNDDNDVHFSEGERLRAMREDEDSVREAPLVALCRALAEAYRQSPESARRDVSENLAERPNRGDSSETRSNQPPLRVFLDAICEWEHGVESLAAALEVLAALAASGDAGARDVWERLRAPPEGAAAAWDHFLGAVAGYNRRFAFGDVEDETVTGDAPYRAATARGAFGGSTDGGLDARAVSSDREMPEADVQGMVAYLDVLTRCLGGGDGDEPRSSSRVSASGAEARDRVAWLSQRCGGSFLDALMRLHANPVPSRLKAALLKCAGAAAGDSAAGAAEAWARMEAAAILQTRANLSLSSSSGAFAFDDAAGYDGGARAHDRFHEQRDGRGGYGRGGVDFDDQAFRAFADGGYGAAAAARQRWLHERRAFEGAERSAAARDQLAVPGADLAYELAYSEARARTYPHASSYVRLVNKLMRACEGGRVGPCADAGRASFAQFAFVRDRVFGELRRRRHNSQEERWWLARDALEHFRIQLRVWRDAVRSGDEDASLAAVDGGRFEVGEEALHERSPRRDTRGRGVDWNAGGTERLVRDLNARDSNRVGGIPPGLEIMTDFMSDGPLFRGVVAVLSLGAERLAAERAAAHGAALEASTAEALALLNDAMALDVATLDATRSSLSSDETASGTERESLRGVSDVSVQTRNADRADAVALRRAVAMRAETVDRSLLRDPSACACVLGFCRYRFDPRVPLRAIQILAVLSERNERLLDLLPPNAVDALAEGAAGVLELASSRAASETSRSTEDENNSSNALDGDPEDAVAAAGAAVLDVILDALPRRAPNVAHALLGLNASPFGDKFTCLTVLLELLEATPPSLCCGDADVAPPEAAARVLFELVADERTAPAALEAVTNWPPGAPGGQQRLALLAADALAATPPLDHTRRAAAAHHRAWLLRVAAAALDFCAPKSSWPVETLDDLPPLAAALARAATRGGDAGFENHPGSAFFENGSSFAVEKPRLAALETLATIPPPPLPPLAAADAALHAFGFLSDETRAARAGLGVDALLSDRRTITEGGCFEVTSRGDAVVSVAALGTRLLENSRRMFETTRLVSSRDAHKLAVQSAVRQARAFNASAEEHAAHAHVAGAWAEFVALVASRCTPARGQSVVEHDPDASEHGGGVDVLFALAEGVLARLAQTPIPRVSSGTGALNSGNFSAFVGDGGGDAWWRALDLPLARLAATLLGELRDGVETKRFLSDEEEEEEEDTESGFSSRAAVAASNATDAAVGGGSPGAGVVDAAAFALSVSPFARGGGGARGQSLSTPDPSRCKALLRGVLGALRRGEARLGTAEGSLGGSSGSSGGKSVALDVDARACAYESLLAFLQYARPKRAAGRFPRSVARLAEGLVGDADGADVRQTADVREGDDAPPNNGSNGSNTSVNVSRETRDARVAARRAARAQDELEAGVGALLRRDAVALADVVGRDIVDPAVDDATRAAALAVAEALLTAVAASGSAAGERAAEHSLRASGFAFGDEETSGEGLPTFPNFAFADENRAPPGGDLSRLPRVAGGNSAAAAGLTPTRSIAPPLVADPATSALARALARAGVIRHCLAAVQSANLSDVILPTAAAAARLAATRAALGVLLRLAQLPGGAKALCESGAMAALAACRAVDAYAHDSPGDAAAAAAAAAARARAEARCAEGGGGAQRRRLGYGDDVNDVFMDGDFSERRRSLDDVDPAAAASVAAASPLARVPLARARHHALLVPVLRLAGTLLNASPDQETRVAAVSFCRAHAAVLHRVLADRSKRAHMCDVAELEAAVALVARLVSFDTSTQETTLNEFVPALDSLTAQIACGDSKYDRFVAAASDARTRPLLKTSHGEVAKRVAESAAGGHALAVGGLSAPVAAAAAAKIEKALRAIRATLVSAQLSLAERGAAVFAFTERPGDGARASPRPTLSSFARLAHRCAEEMREELKARRVELRRLARDGGVAAAAAAFADARGAGGAASAEAAAAFEALAGEGDEELRGASGREAFAGAQGSALGGVADPTTIASLAAAAVGAHERGIRALAVTAEAAIELVLSGGFKGGNAHRFGDDDLGFDDGRGVSNETLTSLAEMFAPAVRALAELDASESAAESAFFGGVLENRPGFETGFAGGVCLDGGRLRALVRRARDALAAAAPPRETAHAPLLAGIEPGTSFEPKRFGGGAVHGAREFW